MVAVAAATNGPCCARCPSVPAQVDDIAPFPGLAFVLRGVGETDVPSRIAHRLLAPQDHAPAAQLDHAPDRPAVALLEHLGLVPGVALIGAARDVNGQPAPGKRTAPRLVPAKNSLFLVQESEDQR